MLMQLCTDSNIFWKKFSGIEDTRHQTKLQSQLEVKLDPPVSLEPLEYILKTLASSPSAHDPPSRISRISSIQSSLTSLLKLFHDEQHDAIYKDAFLKRGVDILIGCLIECDDAFYTPEMASNASKTLEALGSLRDCVIALTSTVDSEMAFSSVMSFAICNCMQKNPNETVQEYCCQMLRNFDDRFYTVNYVQETIIKAMSDFPMNLVIQASGIGNLAMNCHKTQSHVELVMDTMDRHPMHLEIQFLGLLILFVNRDVLDKNLETQSRYIQILSKTFQNHSELHSHIMINLHYLDVDDRFVQNSGLDLVIHIMRQFPANIPIQITGMHVVYKALENFHTTVEDLDGKEIISRALDDKNIRAQISEETLQGFTNWIFDERDYRV